MMSDLNISHEKMSDFVSFPLFGFVLVIKLRNFDFESHWNTLIFFDEKRMCFDGYVLSNNIWFGLSFVFWVKFWQQVEKYGF